MKAEKRSKEDVEQWKMERLPIANSVPDSILIWPPWIGTCRVFHRVKGEQYRRLGRPQGSIPTANHQLDIRREEINRLEKLIDAEWRLQEIVALSYWKGVSA